MVARRSTISLLSRGTTAIAGGYVLANALAWVLAIALSRAGLASLAHAVHWATICSFLIWAGLAMWSFAPGRLTPKLAWMGAAAALCLGVGITLGYESAG